ncbi:MAG: hypothetical protein EZS28_020544 [Streblomastix strix]|uniref:Uncharacterized protein n=1 Tax=Streblomastix strix TaxID=222440 RepID=A0A5J4VNS2_9EUKA|nr:MAG: hypothetical protein EZS28_020544 [Streblomastix strix]
MSPKGIPAVGPEQTGRKSKNKIEQFISIKREEKEKLKLGEVEEDVEINNKKNAYQQKDGQDKEQDDIQNLDSWEDFEKGNADEI